MAVNVTSVGMRRRNRFFLCMCSRNCISFISSVDIAFAVVIMIYQNHQVMVTSFGCSWYSGCAPQSPDCWSSFNVLGKMVAGGWMMIAVSLLKMYARMACEFWVGGLC